MVEDYVKQLKEQADKTSTQQVTEGDTTPEPGGVSDDPPKSEPETQS
jgi:hypothetical protein